MPRRVILLPLLICAACSRWPESYPVPEQRKPLTLPPPTPLSYYFAMEDPNADLYLVQGFTARDAGTWRWTYAHPVLRFYVPAATRMRFDMDYSIPDRTFEDTGPVTLTLRINGGLLDRHLCNKPGQLHYSHEVPPGLVHPNAVNLVSIDPDPVWVSKADGGRLGFILARAGFTE